MEDVMDYLTKDIRKCYNKEYGETPKDTASTLTEEVIALMWAITDCGDYSQPRTEEKEALFRVLMVAVDSLKLVGSMLAIEEEN